MLIKCALQYITQCFGRFRFGLWDSHAPLAITLPEYYGCCTAFLQTKGIDFLINTMKNSISEEGMTTEQWVHGCYILQACLSENLLLGNTTHKTYKVWSTSCFLLREGNSAELLGNLISTSPPAVGISSAWFITTSETWQGKAINSPSAESTDRNAPIKKYIQ